MDDSKVIDSETLSKLEETKKAVLERVAKNLKDQSQQGSVGAHHSSHSSNPKGRTHSSVVSA